MEINNRYIIVTNSGRGRRKAWKILDLHRSVLLPKVYDYKPFRECLELNKTERSPKVSASEADSTPALRH
jgi:hypothetical protein